VRAQGAAFNQSIFPTTLSFYLNGKHLVDQDVSGIRGEVYPVISGTKVAQRTTSTLRCRRHILLALHSVLGGTSCGGPASDAQSAGCSEYV
jgi:hypothetical protein